MAIVGLWIDCGRGGRTGTRLRTSSSPHPRGCSTGAVILLLLCLLLPVTAFAQSPKSQPPRPLPETTSSLLAPGFGPLEALPPRNGTTPGQIIHRFAARETEFQRARKNYTYRETVRFNTFNHDGQADGEYLEVNDIVFAASGQKRKQIIDAPESTLTRIALSPADFEDIEHRLPFVLTEQNIRQYHLTYLGRQAVHQIPSYVFDVAPKRTEKGRRYFSGRIWVGVHDNQILVIRGKAVPDDVTPGQEDLSLPFITYRQKIDDTYWFPAYTEAEGILHFKECGSCAPKNVRVRESVTYNHYQRFGSKVRILFDGVEISRENETLPPAGPLKSQGSGPLVPLPSAGIAMPGK